MKNIIGKGVCDPHIRIFNNRAYLYASHDSSLDNTNFVMPDWWIWSSDNLIDWQHEITLKPEDTFIGEPSNGCWATDAIENNGKYYWYFSDVRDKVRQIGVVVSEHPTGPWHDPLGKPMLSHKSWAQVYDPAIFKDDDGTSYIVFGAFDYYIAKLAEDMISLAESPRKIEITNPIGPYGIKTDDKAFLHKRGNIYYLSWGCFYAMSNCVYGIYDCKGAVISEELVEEGFKSPTWPHGLRQGRHGSFFEWNNQWYFTYCDISHSGNRYYRDSWISYIRYRANGEIAPIMIDSCGVGQYDAAKGKIQASNYFKAESARVVECNQGEFMVSIEKDGASLTYPNIHNLTRFTHLKLSLFSKSKTPFIIEIYNGLIDAELLGIIEVQPEIDYNIIEVQPEIDYNIIAGFNFKDCASLRNLCFMFCGQGAIGTRLEWFEFY